MNKKSIFQKSQLLNTHVFLIVVIIFSSGCRKVSSEFGYYPDFLDIYEGDEIQFNNYSVNGKSYLWDFGDGTTSTVTDDVVYHTYDTNGPYQVTLTTYANGMEATDTENITIVFREPIAEFTTPNDATTFLVNNSVQFTNLSQYADTYSWNFGDGTTYDGANPPAHTYYSTGEKTVSLTASSPGGEDTYQETLNIINQPVACFETDYNLYVVGENITFDSDCSEYEDSYYWTFGDGEYSNDADPTHAYSSAGLKEVSLIVYSYDYASTEEFHFIEIVNAPVACFETAGNVYEFYVGETVSFQNCSSNEDGYYWTFGDGGWLVGSRKSELYIL